MKTVQWTKQAQADLAAIHAFIGQDSPHFAGVIVSRIMAATERLIPFPESGRAVPEFGNPGVRELIQAPYRIVYRLVAANEIHILTVHHSSKDFPDNL